MTFIEEGIKPLFQTIYLCFSTVIRQLTSVRSGTNKYGFGIQADMASKRREEESRRLLESEKVMSDMISDDRTDRFCPKCMVATSLRKCRKCGTETIPME
jgi:hypothetical protein